jgi:integrase
MATATLTKRRVDEARPGTRDLFLWDSTIKGFGVKVTPDGCKTFVLQYRVGGGRRGRSRRFSLGRYGSPLTVEQARREALQLLGDVRHGIDVGAVRAADRASPTLAEFVKERYLPEHVKHKKSAAGDLISLNNHIVPALGRLRLKDITTADISRFKTSLADKPIRLNRCLSLLTHLFNCAHLGNANPAKGVKHYPENRRKRYLGDAELARLNAALTAQRNDLDPIAAALRLLILTGARSAEILTLRWAYIDFERGIALLPQSKEGGKTLYLSAPAMTILAQLPRIDGNPWVLPGLMAGTHLTAGGLHAGWKRVRSAAGLD